MDKNVENRLDKLATVGSIGITIMMLGMVVGIIITALGSGWLTMQKSVLWMSLYWLNNASVIAGLIITMTCAIQWNRLDAMY